MYFFNLCKGFYLRRTLNETEPFRTAQRLHSHCLELILEGKQKRGGKKKGKGFKKMSSHARSEDSLQEGDSWPRFRGGQTEGNSHSYFYIQQTDRNAAAASMFSPFAPPCTYPGVRASGSPWIRSAAERSDYAPLDWNYTNRRASISHFGRTNV